AQVEELWSQIKHLSRSSPTPFDAYFDAITLMGPLYVYRGRQEGVNFFQSVARHMIAENVTNRNYLQRYAQIKRYVEEWNADGVIIHFVKSCRLFSCGQGDMREYFTKQLKVPTLYIESDLEDPRYFAEAQTKNRIDAFFESLEHAKLTGARTGGAA